MKLDRFIPGFGRIEKDSLQDWRSSRRVSEVDSSTAPCRADIVTPTGVEAVKQQIFDSFVPEHRVFGLLFAFVLFFFIDFSRLIRTRRQSGQCVTAAARDKRFGQTVTSKYAVPASDRIGLLLRLA